MSSPTIIERLNEKTVVNERGCWIWEGRIQTDREYGELWVDGSYHKVHCLSWDHHKGPIPEGLNVLHSCDCPPCWNPEHLFLGNHIDNMQDMIAKGRKADMYGSNNPKAIINEDRAREIINLLDQGELTVKQIADKFDLPRHIVNNIKNLGSWDHLREQAK